MNQYCIEVGENGRTKSCSLLALAALIAGTWGTACARPAVRNAGNLVVAIGDSFASGQGAPNEDWTWWKFWSTPAWDDKRCNRSRYSPTAQAVDLLKQQAHAIDSVSFACSGASIARGLLGPYDGSEPPLGAPPLRPQVEELRSVASKGGVEAVTVSIGGNDILFEYLVVSCILSPVCDLNEGLVNLRLAELDTALDLLAAELATVGIESRRIFVVEYPDPTHAEDGAYCNGEPFGDPLAGIDARRARWAAEFVLPLLNDKLCQAARRHGWTYVGDVARRFDTHGWCAGPERWINTIGDSTHAERHPRGGMHPNRTGHSVLGARLAEVIGPLLSGQPLPVVASCPVVPSP
ncbi:MAG TPA: GDSL-type esterase/lipase family protein [Myxococcota bacterium]|nr:GDSL-type esterase/lipase family protein [Myxococcota bacterium]